MSFYKTAVTLKTGGHFPVHIKFPDFSDTSNYTIVAVRMDGRLGI